MAYDSKADIVPLLRHLCLALEPFSITHQINIRFRSPSKSILIYHQPYDVIESLTRVMCSIISYLPPNNTITISAGLNGSPTAKTLRISIHNSGINLSRVTAITGNCKLAVSVPPVAGHQSIFLVHLPVESPSNEAKAVTPLLRTTLFPLFFQEVHSRLQKHFVKINVVAAASCNPRHAAFLERVNECIHHNLSNELFDAAALSNAMAISRTQLFRKLKPIIHQSAGSYIRTLRLQKAKELLETRDVTVSEVADITGFKTFSHFTNVFRRKYGICPSAIRKPKLTVTNQQIIATNAITAAL